MFPIIYGTSFLRWRSRQKGNTHGTDCHQTNTASQASFSSNHQQNQGRKFYDHYNINLLGEIFNAKPKELSGGECAWWSIEFNSQGWTREQIDAKIEDVLKWHNKEIGRIKKIGT